MIEAEFLNFLLFDKYVKESLSTGKINILTLLNFIFSRLIYTILVYIIVSYTQIFNMVMCFR